MTNPQPDIPEDPKPEYTFVQTPEGVRDLAGELSSCSEMAVDLEADSMYHYQEKVCLLQFSACGKNWVVDPLAVGDLSPLAPAFANPGIRKVFHGADYDIRSLYRDFGICVANLFDTQVAACFLGYREIGLANLIAERFGVHLEKKYQKSNWSRRPLPRDMLDYAAMDTVYLLELAHGLAEDLKAAGRLEWAVEESSLLCGVRPFEPNGEPLFLRFKGAGRLNRRTLAVLESLLVFRDEEARRLDRPPFKVMGNHSLLRIAEKKPRTMKELEAIDNVTPKQVRLFGKKILPRVKAAMALPEKELPVYPRPPRTRVDHRVSRRVQSLKEWRAEYAETLALDPGIMLNNAQIRALAASCPKTREDLDRMEEIRDWQKSALGAELLSALARPPKKKKKAPEKTKKS
ncbi:MAG: HRDC domain-containing protein [Deltaproteobacteria bacterium]|nr:HRDC domain-containing protein [Deltaproteobacteria bacterium]